MPKHFDSKALLTDDGAGLILILNPGTEPINEPVVDLAVANMPHLMKDTGLAGLVSRRAPAEDYADRYQDGRYAFYVVGPDGKEVEVQMPGVPLQDVRYTGAADQNIWDYPRLYVEGSSWVWTFAVGQLHSALTGDSDWEWNPAAAAVVEDPEVHRFEDDGGPTPREENRA